MNLRGDHDLVVVANRLPIQRAQHGDDWETSPGGLVRAMFSVLHHRRGGIRIGVRLLQWPEAGGTGSGTGPEPAGRLLGVEADERSRISRELHDGLGQILTSIALFAKSIEDEVPPAQRRRVASLRMLVDDALVSTRSLVWSLRPAELHRSGLLDSLTRLARGVREQAGLRFTPVG